VGASFLEAALYSSREEERLGNPYQVGAQGHSQPSRPGRSREVEGREDSGLHWGQAQTQDVAAALLAGPEEHREAAPASPAQRAAPMLRAAQTPLEHRVVVRELLVGLDAGEEAAGAEGEAAVAAREDSSNTPRRRLHWAR